MELNDYQNKDFHTQNGDALDINLVYATHGKLNENRDNAILVVTSSIL